VGENVLKKNLIKIYFGIVVTLLTLITLKSNQEIRSFVYKHIYTNNISFATINKWYKSNFGNPLPFEKFLNSTSPVFNETLQYTSANKYKDGVALQVGSEYLIPALESGIVIFIGEKEGYGNTVILQQENGVDVWYSNISEANVKLYDYIKKSDLIGSVNETLYLVFLKNSEVIDYEKYI